MIKGFITNLGKYTEGQLIGKWISFPITEEEMEEVFQEIGINENYEEYFFTDWECEIDLNLGEYENIERINDLAETLESFSDYEIKKIKAACEIESIENVLEMDIDDIDLFEDVNTDYDLGYYWIEESGCYDLSALGNLANYIDYESFGRDLRLEARGGFTSYGFVEIR